MGNDWPNVRKRNKLPSTPRNLDNYVHCFTHLGSATKIDFTLGKDVQSNIAKALGIF